ncbi:MAG: nucleoside monophosphate kinase [Acidobacteriota bacterium]|jgi:adenylate kinase|nr:nucleoside monophosphate kinase [Acidobacteriota bacterium]
MTRIILFGAPGSGKGTQARRLEQRFGYRHISTGDLIRTEVSEETALGQRVRPILEAGGYIDDETMLEMVKRRVAQADISDGYVLDGFPRTINQARALSALTVAREIPILLDIKDEELIVKRILSRVTCGRCGAVYNLEVNPPRTPGRCDQCGEQLTRRSDDSEASVHERLHVFRERTLPVLEYYRERGDLFRVNAALPIDRVSAAIEEIVA